MCTAHWNWRRHLCCGRPNKMAEKSAPPLQWAPNWTDIRYARPNSRFSDTHDTLTIKVKAEIGFAVGGGAGAGAVD